MQAPHEDSDLLGSQQKKKILHAILPEHAGGSPAGGAGTQHAKEYGENAPK